MGFVKPSAKKVNAELNSICVEFVPNADKTRERQYDGFMLLKSIGKKYGKLYMPIRFNKRYHKWSADGFEMMTSFLFKDGKVQIRMKKKVEMHAEGRIVGADQGMRKTMVFSDGVMTEQVDSQGKSLKRLYEKLARKKWGSKAHRRARIEL